MQRQTTLSFDRLAWLTMATIAVAIALVVLRGDQIKLDLTYVTPPPDTTGISTRTQIQLHFAQPLAPLPTGTTLQIVPPLAGKLVVAQDTVTFVPAAPLSPYTTYRATLIGDLHGQQGGSLRDAITWQFATGGVQIAYTAIDGEGRERLFITDALLTEPTKTVAAATQLTTGPLNLWDFSVSPTGQLVYSTLKEDGTSDLWLIQPGERTATRFVPCPNAVCSSSAWSPDGKLLAYARRNATEFGAAALSPPRLWLFDPATGESVPIFADNQTLAFDPSWSFDGGWLGYVAPDSGGVGIVNLATGETNLYATTSGETGSWHPGANRFLYSLLRPLGDQYASHLILVDPLTGTTENLSGEDALVEDGSPAWSPDGNWIAWRRKELTGPGATPGKQIWLMRADGSDAHALTADAAYDQSAPHWSPDGRYLLFHKLPLKGPNITMSVWVLDVVTGESWPVAEPGQRPQWVP